MAVPRHEVILLQIAYLDSLCNVLHGDKRSLGRATEVTYLSRLTHFGDMAECCRSFGTHLAIPPRARRLRFVGILIGK